VYLEFPYIYSHVWKSCEPEDSAKFVVTVDIPGKLDRGDGIGLQFYCSR
jgi:hypothetical protein